MLKTFTLISFLFLSQSLLSQSADLELRLEKKQQFGYSITTSLDITQYVNGDQSDTKMEFKNDVTFKVKNTKNDQIDLTSQYEKLNLELVLPEYTMTINSESTDENDTFSKILSQLVNQPFQVSISKKGEILSVSGLTKIIDNAFTDFKNLPQAKVDQLKGQITKAFGEEAFKGSIQAFLNVFPTDPVVEKDSWNIATAFNDGMSARIDSEFVLEQIRKNQAKITSTGVIESVDKEKYFELNGNYFKYDLVGTTDSDIVLNPKTGQIIEAVTRLEVSGDSYLKPNDQITEEVTIPIELSNKTVITRLD